MEGPEQGAQTVRNPGEKRRGEHRASDRVLMPLGGIRLCWTVQEYDFTATIDRTAIVKYLVTYCVHVHHPLLQ